MSGGSGGAAVAIATPCPEFDVVESTGPGWTATGTEAGRSLSIQNETAITASRPATAMEAKGRNFMR